MKVPKRLRPLVDDGLIDEIITQLMSGKEAQVYVVRSRTEIRCAKVYKEANQRSFRQAVQYTEGRKVKNSRQARAMSKRSGYGQKEAEEAWLNAEVDALYRLAAAGVRVPTPFCFVDGVLLMELVTDADGNAAPRLNDVTLTPEQARDYHKRIIKEIVRMLCAGIVHGDLSPFNVLVDQHGPVIIDLPQAVNAAGNNSAGMMLERDVDNMATCFGRFAPELLKSDYGKEIWGLYLSGMLHPTLRSLDTSNAQPLRPMWPPLCALSKMPANKKQSVSYGTWRRGRGNRRSGGRKSLALRDSVVWKWLPHFRN